LNHAPDFIKKEEMDELVKYGVSDGIDMYLKMKKFEGNSPKTEFTYWIEKSILCYL
jgi:hypothetical protein